LAKRVSYAAPHHTVLSNLPPLLLPEIQTLYSTLYSQTPSVYVLPLVWDTNSHTHTKHEVTLQFCIFQCLEHSEAKGSKHSNTIFICSRGPKMHVFGLVHISLRYDLNSKYKT